MHPGKPGLCVGLLVALALACQPPSDSPGDSSDTGDSDETGGADGPPILEQPPVLSHDCEVTAPLTEVAGSGWRTEALAVVDGSVWQVRSDSDALALSTVTADGSLGTSIELDGEDWTYREADLVAADGQLAATWIHTTPVGDVSIRFAVFAADGTTVVAPHDLDGISGQWVQGPRVLPRAVGGWTVLYGDADAGGLGTLRLVHIDAAGEPIAAPVDAVAGGQNFGTFGPSVVTTAGGYALTYTDNLGPGPEVFFVSLDADGAPRSAPRRLSRAAGDGWYSSGYSNALLAVGDRFWAGWTESWQNDDFADPKGNTTVHIGVVDADGVGPSYLLSAPVEGKSVSWPTFFAFEDRVGLVWTTGTMIFICAGCVYDYDVNLVLLDPETLAPASPVTTHLHGATGLFRPQPAVLGPQIVLAADIDRHAFTVPAVGATTCTPRP
jgi:hypothetical protein